MRNAIPTDLTRKTAQQLAERLGVDETEAIHLALRQLAVKVLLQYEPDDGPLRAAPAGLIKNSGQPRKSA